MTDLGDFQTGFGFEFSKRVARSFGLAIFGFWPCLTEERRLTFRFESRDRNLDLGLLVRILGFLVVNQCLG